MACQLRILRSCPLIVENVQRSPSKWMRWTSDLDPRSGFPFSKKTTEKDYFPSEYSPVNAQTSEGLNAFTVFNETMQCAIPLLHEVTSVASYKVKQR